MILIFFMPAAFPLVMRPPGIPVKIGRGKRKILSKTNYLSKSNKGIMQTYIIFLCCFWKIHSIKMSWHNIIITPIYDGLTNKIYYGKWFGNISGIS